MNCSVRFLKTGIVESSSKCLVQFYFHYSKLCQKWIQKTGSFLFLNSIYELKKFLQNPPKKEKVRFPFRFSSDFSKWIKLENSYVFCSPPHHSRSNSTWVYRSFARAISSPVPDIWAHLDLMLYSGSDHRTAAGESSCYELYNQKKQIQLKQWNKFCTTCWPDGIVNCYNSSAKQRKEVF